MLGFSFSLKVAVAFRITISTVPVVLDDWDDDDLGLVNINKIFAYDLFMWLMKDQMTCSFETLEFFFVTVTGAGVGGVNADWMADKSLVKVEILPSLWMTRILDPITEILWIAGVEGLS